VPNFVSFATSIAELAHGEKSCTQSLNHPAYLMPWEPTHLRFGKITSKNHYGAMITGTGVFSVFHGILPTAEPIWHHRADCSRPCSQQKQMTGLQQWRDLTNGRQDNWPYTRPWQIYMSTPVLYVCVCLML